MSEPVSTAPARPADVDEMHAELIRRFALIGELQTARDAEKRRVQDAQCDLEHFVRTLATLEDERDQLKRRLAELARPWPRRMASALGFARSVPAVRPEPAPVPGAVFTYFLYTSPYRLFRSPGFTLRGWAFPADGRPVTALRARVDEQEYHGTYGLPEPEVIAHHGPQPNNPQPGFKIAIETPAGRHRLSLEARVEDGDWVSFLTAPVFARHDV
ncbi:MAG TPA: hypothetical protein VHE61_18740 [Opitutaceae bacterium]|nr:hypothetical protein [Opitutaceae bacterium]